MRDGSPNLDPPEPEPQPHARPPVRPAPTWLAYALLFGLSLSLGGYRSLDGDQAYRLPLLLHQQDPAVFAADPFVRAFDAFNPHQGYLTLLDFPSRLIGLPAALFLLYAVTYAITCLGVRFLARTLWPGSGEWVALLAVALLLLADAGNIGTNHLFEPMLLDRLIAFSLGWVALALFLRSSFRFPSPSPRSPGEVRNAHSASYPDPLLPPSPRERGEGRGEGSLAKPMNPAILTTALLTRPSATLSPAGGGEGSEIAAPHLTPSPRERGEGRGEGFPSLLKQTGRLHTLAIAVLIGLAGLVHPALGMQLAMLLGTGWLLALIAPARLAMDRPSAWFGLVALVMALLPTVLIQAPQKTALFEGLDPDTFRLLSFTVQGPQHMLPHLWRPMQWLAWFCYPALAIATLWDLGRPLSIARTRCLALLGILLVALAAAWVAIELLGDPRVTIFQPFRMATVVRGLCLVLIADRIRSLAFLGGFGGLLRAALLISGLGSDGAMVVAVASELTWTLGDRLRAPRTAASCALAVLLGGIAYLIRHDPDAGYLPLLLGIGAASLMGAWRLRGRALPAWTPGRALRLTTLAYTVPILAAIAAILPPDGPEWLRTGRDALISRCRFGESPADDIERLALWARSHTPPDARFIGPPGPKTFRLWSRREVAFNRAAGPYDGHGLADWARRFADHVAFEGDVAAFARAYLADRHALERRYQEMSEADRASLARRQGAAYILSAAPSDRDESAADPSLELLRIDGRYAIYRLRDAPNSNPPATLADRRASETDLAQRREAAESSTIR